VRVGPESEVGKAGVGCWVSGVRGENDNAWGLGARAYELTLLIEGCRLTRENRVTERGLGEQAEHLDVRQNSDALCQAELSHVFLEEVGVSRAEHVCPPGECCAENGSISLVPE